MPKPLIQWVLICFALAGCLSSVLALDITLKKANWGKVSNHEIQKVLESTAMQLLPHSPILRRSKIEVSRTQSSPIVLHERGTGGAYQVKLNTGERFWTQYAFQFSHELGHIICGYKKGENGNQWFEECICEVASLYSLNNITKEWSRKPPFPNWKSYAKEFSKYAEARIRDAKMPKSFSLSSWWRENREVLSKNPSMRRQNLWVAVKLLPLFQSDPTLAWSTCNWLNQKKTNKARSFRRSLQDWKDSCPSPKEKQFVKEVAKLFGIHMN